MFAYDGRNLKMKGWGSKNEKLRDWSKQSEWIVSGVYIHHEDIPLFTYQNDDVWDAEKIKRHCLINEQEVSPPMSQESCFPLSSKEKFYFSDHVSVNYIIQTNTYCYLKVSVQCAGLT